MSHSPVLHFDKRYFHRLLTIEFQLSCYDFVNPYPGRVAMQEKAEDITGLLTSWRAGDRTALDRLRSYTGLRDATSRFSLVSRAR